jgi:hypothetical protein
LFKVRLIILFVVGAFSVPALAQGVESHHPSRDLVAFVTAATITKDRIASNVNLIQSYFSPDKDNKQNTTFATGSFDDVELDCYRRAMTGMQLTGYYYDKNSTSRTIFYSPTYDVGLIAEWITPESGKPLLRELFLVSGELLRNASVKIVQPGWTEGGMEGIVDAYKGVKLYSAKVGTTPILKNAETSPQWTLADGKKVGDRDLVHQRIMLLGTALLSHAREATIAKQSPDAIAFLHSVKPAVDAASDMIDCLKVGGLFEDALKCEMLRHPFKTTSLPKTVTSKETLAAFLKTAYVEGALPIENISLAFIASYSPANNYRIIVGTRNGEPSGLTVIDLDAQ